MVQSCEFSMIINFILHFTWPIEYLCIFFEQIMWILALLSPNISEFVCIWTYTGLHQILGRKTQLFILSSLLVYKGQLNIVGIFAIIPDEIKSVLLGLPRGLKACCICLMQSYRLRKWCPKTLSQFYNSNATVHIATSCIIIRSHKDQF